MLIKDPSKLFSISLMPFIKVRGDTMG